MLPPRSFLSSAIALLASSSLLQNVAAQVTTDCFPMKKECPADPALGMDFNFNFNQTPKAGTWDTTVGPVKYDAKTGAAFTINKQGDSPTIRSSFYFFFGRTEIWMKAASGTGVISSVMLLSDNLDEIDWEFFGGNNGQVQSNYFGKNNSDFHNAGLHNVVGGVQNDYHNYTQVWTKDALDFYIDGAKVRTLLPKDANNTYYYPQTPMRMSIGIWAGGDPTLPKGTREWAGGDTDYSKGPFTMFVKSAHITDYSSGKEYTYGDKTGSWQSIRITQGNSTAKEKITAPPEQPAPSVSEKFNALSPTAKIAIYASAAGLGTALFAFALFYCIRQRRRGAREERIAAAKAEEERLELERFKKAGVDPDSFVDSATEYNAKDMRRDGLSDNNSYSVPVTPGAATPVNEKWEKAAAVGAGAGAGAAAAAGAMRSPMPLLQNGARSPGMASPSSDRSPFNTPYSDRAANNQSPASNFNPHEGSRSPAPLGNIRPPGPGMTGPAPSFPQPSVASPSQPFPPPVNRSFSSPNAQMRGGYPGPQQPGLPRMTSPAPMAQPQPQRSYTAGGYGAPSARSPPAGAYGNGGNGGNAGYWGNGYGGNGGYGGYR
ncbi:glycoside hydrolase family 16 protein [Lasiosphaeria ovina]|uniref:chitinase n=1 Tax=Lasiosphaeria ovina TaxID=92902 RepID=A0AAE0JZR3_9PEZI|nr:glycoside hydrolase family 16 protein [Lasiosphaeria ovina]